MDLDNADLTATGIQIVNDLFNSLADRAHSHDNIGRILSSVIIERLIVGAYLGINLIHVGSNDIGGLEIGAVAGLAMLEESLRLLGRAHGEGVIGVERTGLECVYSIPVDHIAEILIVPGLDLLVLMRGAETIKEMEHGQSAVNGGKMSDSSEVHNLLDGVGAKHCKTGLTAGHNVAVVAENAQRMACKSAGRNMEHSRSLLAGELIHVGDHQKQTLRSGESAGIGTSGNGAVNSAGGTCLGLHLDDLYFLAKEVLSVIGYPLVHTLRHGRRRSDGINSRYLGECIGNMSSCSVAIHCFDFSHIPLLSFLIVDSFMLEENILGNSLLLYYLAGADILTYVAVLTDLRINAGVGAFLVDGEVGAVCLTVAAKSAAGGAVLCLLFGSILG